MTRMLGRRRAVFVLALMLSLMMLLLAAGSAQAAVLRAGAHGRANIVDPGRAIPALPQTGSGGLGATGIAASLVGLAAVLALVSVAGKAGWQSGGEEAFARQLSAVSAAPHDDRRLKDHPEDRKAA
jgi:hypothetical protein